MKIFSSLLTFLLIFLFCVESRAQEGQSKLSPADTVKEFYRLLREKKYREGFKLSVYAAAVENLTQEQLEELKVDFDAAFSEIPESIRVLGAQASGRSATVFIKSSPDQSDSTVEEVLLVKEGDYWLVGDDDTLKMVRELGSKFFFEIRIRVSEKNAQAQIERFIGSEKLYHAANRGVYGTVDDLINAQFWQPSQRTIYSGYKFTVEISEDKKSFFVHAEPLEYNKSGRVSFYGDLTGVYRFDNGGKVYKVELGQQPKN